MLMRRQDFMRAIAAFFVIFASVASLKPRRKHIRTKSFYVNETSVAATWRRKIKSSNATALGLFQDFLSFSGGVSKSRNRKADSNNTAFAFVCSPDDSSWKSTLVAAHRIRSLGLALKFPIIVLLVSIPTPPQSGHQTDATDRLSKALPGEAYSAFSAVGNVQIVESYDMIPIPPTVKFDSKDFRSFSVSWQKLHFFRMTEYSRIIYIDSDVVFLRDISSLVHVTPFASVPLSCDHKLDHSVINGGLMILRPSITTFNELLFLASLESSTGWKLSEQELLGVYYAWLYPDDYTSLSTHYMIPVKGLSQEGLLPLTKHRTEEIKHWLHDDVTMKDVVSSTKMVHFCCFKKPW